MSLFNPNPKVLINSLDIVLNGKIPKDFKSTLCGEANRSPTFAWTPSGFVTGHVAYWVLCVEDLNVPGTSSNGLFMHWDVREIDAAQQQITTSGGWSGNPIIGSSDHPFGDRTNGWNGPCSASSSHFRVTISAIIKDESLVYVFGAGKIPGNKAVTGYYYFDDDSANASNRFTTGQCGTPICPSGTTYVNGVCQEIQTAPVIVSPSQYTVGPGDQLVPYGQYGMRIYENVDYYIFPLKGSSTTALLSDNNGVGVPVAINASSPVSNAVWDSEGTTTKGRLNIAGIWTTLVPNPLNEWIGFSKCIEVPTTKEYCIGLAADNRMRFTLNGQLIVEFTGAPTANFDYWHVIPITLTQGLNVLELEGLNVGSEASFAAEIYDATPAQLIAVPDVPTLESYLVFSTKDKIGDSFDIGDDSGYICPPGFAYNACSGGNCVKIIYSQPTIVECCWRIQNCKVPAETFLIKLSSSELTPLYGNDIYSFAGSQLFTDKCFVVIGEEVCTVPDFDNVTVLTVYGTDNCTVCDPSLEFQSCLTGDLVYLSLSSISDVPNINEIYDFTTPLLEGCWKYLGLNTQNAATYIDVIIDTSYGEEDCIICKPCLRFRNCISGSEFLAHLLDGTPSPIVNNVYSVYPEDPVLDGIVGCWTYLGSELCVDPFLDLELTDMNCDDCGICTPKYLLTNCENANDTLEIWWNPLADALDPTHAYIFDFEPDICYTAERIYSTCEPIGSIFDTPNILTDTSESCLDCNRLCYVLIDCSTGEYLMSTVDLQVYLGKFIRWSDPDTGRETTCSLVDTYVCRRETYVQVTPIIETCVKTCEECLPVEVTEPEFVVTRRAVTPNINTLPCVSETTNCDDCEC